MQDRKTPAMMPLTNYEVDRTIRHAQQKAGSVQRLSVAVVVNDQGVDKDGNP